MRQDRAGLKEVCGQNVLLLRLLETCPILAPEALSYEKRGVEKRKRKEKQEEEEVDAQEEQQQQRQRQPPPQ